MGLSCTGPLRHDSFSIDPSSSNPCSRVNSTAGNPHMWRANCSYMCICDCKVPLCYSRVSCRSTLNHNTTSRAAMKTAHRQPSSAVMHQPSQASRFYPKSLPHLPIRCGTATRPHPHAHTLFFKESICCPLHGPSGGAPGGSVLHCQCSPVGSFSAARGGHSLDDCLPVHLTSPPPCQCSFHLTHKLHVLRCSSQLKRSPTPKF